MSGSLTTTVFDAQAGIPAAAMLIDLFRLERGLGERRHLRSIETNAQGGVDESLLGGDALAPATYELLYHVGRYFKARGVALDDGPFLDLVPLRFSIADPSRGCHLTLLAAPWSYTMYRA